MVSEMLPLKMQSRSKTQPVRPWMSEPGLLVDREVHPLSGSANRAKSRPREWQQLRQLDPMRPVVQSSWPPTNSLAIFAATLTSALLIVDFEFGSIASKPLLLL